MSAPVTIQLQRMSTMQPWGFRLQGGQDFRQELSIKKVEIPSFHWNFPFQKKID